ncbi:energy transducer TonB [Mucilaginibacter sp. UR6-11]|uniref:energy transducer TonB n=1 Tax=Mucilaginibacter sp. UR6-11 TaxID=1435644 RepID=UPI001E5AE520|nr:energy transducer TonB [Mucilaginibacter sp. UR6-11]MCC8425896.1 energy transducer TonB [Mucilaginibacter sp. UR6-11]
MSFIKVYYVLFFGVLSSFCTYAQNSKKTELDKAKDNSTIDIRIDEPIPEPEVNPTHDKNFIYNQVESQPQFRGGMEKLSSFLKKNLKWPYLDKDYKEKVIANFVVEKNGMITNIKIVRGLSDDFNAEVVRVLKLSPKWLPGLLNGKPVRVSYTIPITSDLYNK